MKGNAASAIKGGLTTIVTLLSAPLLALMEVIFNHKHSECTGPNQCTCYTGWQGPTCALGVCKKCEYGICSAPDTCECFYGYTGPNCDIPVSHPDCVNGVAVLPDKCQCNTGWSGPICDVPFCPLGCNNGYCVDAQVCECYPGFYSSNSTSLCDTRECSYFDMNCFSCNNSQCLECQIGFFLDSSTLQCNSCVLAYDPNCLQCDSSSCQECKWPFKLNQTTNLCYNFGMIEFATNNLTVIETQGSYTVTVRRLFGTSGTISVDFMISNSYPLFTRVENIFGRLIFADNQTELTITGQVYKRQYVEQNNELATFILSLYNPSINSELGYNKDLIISYFDDENNMNDAYYTEATLNGTYNVQSELTVYIGDVQNLTIQCMQTATMPKVNGNDLYILRLQYQNGSDVEYIISTNLVNEFYQILFIAKSPLLKAARIYATSPGFSMYYYENTRFLSIPFIARIENSLPYLFGQETGQLSYFSLRVEAFLIYQTSNQTSEVVTYTVTLADQASAQIFIDNSPLFDTGAFNCFGQYYSSIESCCLQTMSFTLADVDMTGSQPYYLRIDYRHKVGPPCIRVFRQSYSLPFAPIEQEALSMTELKESPFILQALINPDLINIPSTGKLCLIQYLQPWKSSNSSILTQDYLFLTTLSKQLSITPLSFILVTYMAIKSKA